MIWNREYETMDREALRELQLRRLQSTVSWVYERVPYYREELDRRGVRPRDIKSLDDVRKLPFTDKTALRDTYPFGMFAVDLDDVVRIHSSSGTTGKPIVVGYTRGDLNTWTELTARVAAAAGVTHTDRAQMAFGYGMFTGGFGMHYGIERIGATVIPASAGNTERHLMMMEDFQTTVLVSTPSYALFMAEVGEKAGIDFSKLMLRVGLFGGEPCSGVTRSEIEERLHIRATDNYGLSEVMGPGVSGECEADTGLHIAEDHFLVEIVDPETDEPVEPGQEGELIITPLSKEAFPVLKRTDDMLIIRGVNVFPSQIEDVLFKIEGIRPHYLIVLDRKHGLDDFEVQIEVAEEVFSDIMADMVAFTKHVAERLHSVLGLHARVKLVEPGTVERTAGKARRVLDRRGDDGC
jgi:phenylacetate-CoA ligase